MKKYLQSIIQIISLVLFIFLIISGKVQLWMGVFLLGIVGALVLGRVFCGWICPINTGMQGVTWLKKKMHINNLNMPKVATKPWFRYFVLGLFIVTFIFTMKTGQKAPILPILSGLGVFLTFLYPEELWHRYICPFGTILSFPASKSKYSMKINPDLCNNCGACNRVCPAKAIEKEQKHHKIITKDCLVCMKCVQSCKRHSIHYKVD